jgi:predicted small metal-binding protein
VSASGGDPPVTGERVKTTRRGEPVAKVISCDCGYIARGETEEELLADAERHIRSDHPEMVGNLTQEQLLEMADEV